MNRPPESPSVAAQLRAHLDTLPRAEKRVARVLLAGYPTSGLEPLSAVARQAQTSTATVLRLAQRIGYEGYPEMQQALKRETQERYASPVAQYAEARHDTGQDVVARSREVLMESTASTLRRLAPDELLRAADLLADPGRRIATLGGRFSTVLASYLAAHLQQLRPGVRHLSSTAKGAYLLDAGRRDVVVVFDYRRYQRETVAFARDCAARGAKIILCSDPWLSPAVAVADAVLPAQVRSPSPFDSLTPAVAVVETLIAAVVERTGETGRQRVAAYDRIEGDIFTEDERPTVPHLGTKEHDQREQDRYRP